MNEGWTTGRVVTLFFMAAIIFLCWHLLGSLERQQDDLNEVSNKLDAIRQISVSVKLEGLDNIVVHHEGLPAQTVPIVMPPANGGESAAPAVERQPAPRDQSATPRTSRRRFDDGKDAIGRPLAAAAGFTIYPPIDMEIPGRTVARKPDFIPEQCGTFVNSRPSDPDKANYYLTNDGTLTNIDRDVHLKLFTINPDRPQELWPELAVAWETSDDKLTYRFHLRRDVVFSDGTPFDADDVVFTFNMCRDPSVESDHLKSAFEDVESVRMLDPLTVEVRMRRLYWKALKTFGYSLRIFPKEFFEQRIPIIARRENISPWSTVPGEPGFGKCFNTFAREMPPGTGPYQWREGESWVSNQHITLYTNPTCFLRELNPDHYRLEKLRWRIIRDDVARRAEFKNGTVDVQVVDKNAWEDELSEDPVIERIAEYHHYDHTGLLYSFLGFNCREFPFDDVAVRRAIAHLMNRERIHQELERGLGQIATCPTKPIYPEYSHDIEPHEYDPAKAARILAEAGWADTDGDGLLDKDGRILEFTFKTGGQRKFFTTVSTWLQEACAQIGVRCLDDSKEWSLFLEDFYKRNFQLVCLYNSAPDPWIDPYDNYHSSLVGDQQGNHWGWQNDEVDTLLEEMRREFDDEKRAAMFHRLNHIFHEELPQLLLIHGEVSVIVNRRLQGAKVRLTGLQHFDMWIRPEDVRN